MKTWLKQLLDEGLVPYVATSEHNLKHLDLSIFEGHEIIKILEDEKDRNFHEAYLVSNSFAFGNPELKMPNWVYIDCVLMPTAVIGFAIPTHKAPPAMLDFYERDPWVDVTTLDYIPVSGQIASLALGAERLVGFSLFSLRKQLSGFALGRLAAKTKYAALCALKADKAEAFVAISQYDNKALLTHTLFGQKMYIEQTTSPMHPLRDMSFTYKMKVDLDESHVFRDIRKNEPDYDFLLKSDDLAKKQEMQARISAGERFYIADPVHIRQDNGLYIPIKIEKD